MRKVKMLSISFLLIIVLFPTNDDSKCKASEINSGKAANEVRVYPPLPGNKFMSDRYEVNVIASKVSQNSYVYCSPNNDPRWRTKWPTSEIHMTLENHFTTFSFSGKVLVQIKLPMRTSISSVVIRPLSKKLTASIKGNTITIPLKGPANFFVEIDGEKRYPLFIFANPVEQNIPSPTDTNIIYFGPGIHEIGIENGPMQNIPAGKTVYLAGGAYVKGVLKITNGAKISTIRGRGILSGIDIKGYSAYKGNIEARQGTLHVEGIIILDSPQGYQGIIAHGNGSVVENVKLLSWAMESDSGALGPDSQITNCFFKISDDVLKPTSSGILFKDNIVWQQMCGSAIMLGWNSSSLITGATVSGLDIIGCDVGEISNPKASVLAIINLRNSNGATYKNILIENVRIEKRPYMLIGIAIKQTDPGWVDNPRYNKGLGSIDGIVFRNISMPGVPPRISVLNGNGNVTPESTGDIKNVTFENVIIDGTRLTEKNVDKFISRLANTSGFTYK
jgi:hypothetical protein